MGTGAKAVNLPKEKKNKLNTPKFRSLATVSPKLLNRRPRRVRHFSSLRDWHSCCLSFPTDSKGLRWVTLPTLWGVTLPALLPFSRPLYSCSCLFECESPFVENSHRWPASFYANAILSPQKTLPAHRAIQNEVNCTVFMIPS